ncbi:MAG TPA: Mur ligase family protein [Steroidobacteraceae bacterium]
MLDVVGIALDADLIMAWRMRLERALLHLGWPTPQSAVRNHEGGVSLALVAPLDQLFLATEINEWALCASLYQRDPERWHQLQSLLVNAAIENAPEGEPPAADNLPVLEEQAAFERFLRLQRIESRPALRSLLIAASARQLAFTTDDAIVTLGSGEGARSFPLERLPAENEVPWQEVFNVPTVLVTGSNGKTTTVRLLAALARAQGLRVAYNCTDGVFLDDEQLAQGDYSGPEGTRRVIREPRAQFAVLETARGGILRRGIAVSQADAALVTNVSADHFGEYGIYDIAGLAAVKLAVAGVVSRNGHLLLNAEDAELCAQAPALERRFSRPFNFGWFSAGAARAPRELLPSASFRCEVEDGRLKLHREGAVHDLGPVATMPLTVEGIARYNLANIAGAALAAASVGISPETMRVVLMRFGTDSLDNPGRLMRFEARGVTVLVDYAHNPDGLRGFLAVAEHLKGPGRLGLLLGHAGNRTDQDIRELARVAAEFRPDFVVVKENEAYLRGRQPGEIPEILATELKRLGVRENLIAAADNEIDAARRVLAWAKAGDVLALPVHSLEARNAVIELLSASSANR